MKKSLSFELDLMDWKLMERNAKASIDDHKVSLCVSEILFNTAVANIVRLGGKTLAEEEEEIKKNASYYSKE